jgi:hypothetical protein
MVLEPVESIFCSHFCLKNNIVDSPYNKDPTVKTSGLRGVYNKFRAHFGY